MLTEARPTTAATQKTNDNRRECNAQFSIGKIKPRYEGLMHAEYEEKQTLGCQVRGKETEAGREAGREGRQQCTSFYPILTFCHFLSLHFLCLYFP